MRPQILIVFLLFLAGSCRSQSIEDALQRYNKESIPYVRTDALNLHPEAILLDARSREEFAVSTIPGAIWVGYKEFDPAHITSILPDRSVPLLVFCSIGVRSENIGERLKKLGYWDVKNLYGGIFRYKNTGNTVVDSLGRPTEKVHAFNRNWGRLLLHADKVY